MLLVRNEYITTQQTFVSKVYVAIHAIQPTLRGCGWSNLLGSALGMSIQPLREDEAWHCVILSVRMYVALHAIEVGSQGIIYRPLQSRSYQEFSHRKF